MEWLNSPSEPNFQDDLESASVLSYMSKGKKRKQDFSDEEDDIIMLDSQAGDKTDDEIELDARKNMAGSSTGTSQCQFHRKNEKRKKNNTN